jgi:hypothetical protein
MERDCLWAELYYRQRQGEGTLAYLERLQGFEVQKVKGLYLPAWVFPQKPKHLHMLLVPSDSLLEHNQARATLRHVLDELAGDT